MMEGMMVRMMEGMMVKMMDIYGYKFRYNDMRVRRIAQ
jgi:hypothetical protein